MKVQEKGNYHFDQPLRSGFSVLTPARRSGSVSP
jgi:hypothetical protein